MIKEAVWHHSDLVVNGHPSAECQVERDLARVGHVQLDFANWGCVGFWLVIMRLQEGAWDQGTASRDICEHEITTLCAQWDKRKVHFIQFLYQIITHGAEIVSCFCHERWRSLNLDLISEWQSLAHGDLCWCVLAIEHVVINYSTQSQQLRMCDGPADLPAGGVHELTSAVDCDCSVPIVGE